jgi:predicted phage baseplate assembly protein
MSTFGKETLDTCGCCGEDIAEPGLYNRPGLLALDYRVARHGQFLQRMLDRLPQQQVADELDPSRITRPLADLATRATDDASIALLDAWASTLDVLTFYQERIANEGFLHTATERRSVLELARMIGYRLKPGVAASAWLAFTVEDKDDRFRTTTVPAGTQVLSIPSQGELPQTFETDEEIEAQAQWNALQPRLGLSQYLALRDDELYLVDIDGSLGLSDAPGAITIALAGDHAEDRFHPVGPGLNIRAVIEDPDRSADVTALPVTQIYLKGTATRLAVGDQLLLVGRNSDDAVHTLTRTVRAVDEDKDRQLTLVQLGSTTTTPFVAAFRLPLLIAAAPTLAPLSFNAATVADQVLKFSWTQNNLAVAMRMNSWSGRQLKLLLQQPRAVTSAGRNDGVFVFREKCGFFGHNAQAYSTLVAPEDGSVDAMYPVNWDDTDGDGTPISVWQDPTKDQDPPADYALHDCYLERPIRGLTTDSWIAFKSSSHTNPVVFRVDQADEVSVTGFSLSAKTSGLKLTQADGSAITRDDTLAVRTTTAYSNSERLTLADIPVSQTIDNSDPSSRSLMLDELVLDLRIGQAVALSGERSDAPGVVVTEIKVLEEITHYGGFTVLQFDEDLDYSYRRDSVQVNANVARSSHGETVDEVLGGGDATKTHQAFRLRKKPLTYTSAATPSGAESSLHLWVNGVEWQQVDALYTSRSDSEHFSVRIDDSAVPIVTFGDGVHGARLPTGAQNITAQYRSGIGVDGEVAAGSLSLLKKRPAGISAVINPEAASGAEDPETRDDARHNAPQTVRTLDRIVSLRDFEDFAATYAGIGKARAVPIWTGEAYCVHITLATASGEPLVDDSTLKDNLVQAIDAVRDPTVAVELAGFQALYFNVEAGLKIDERYLPDQVKAQVRSELEQAFCFARRTFGQSVTAAEVIALIQAVPGVVHVDLDALYRVASDGTAPEDTTPASVIPALPARLNESGNGIDAGQLLLISTAGISLQEINDE